MIIKEKLEDGRYLVYSDKGNVDIGSGPAKKLIVSKDEIEYVEESKEEWIT